MWFSARPLSRLAGTKGANRPLSGSTLCPAGPADTRSSSAQREVEIVERRVTCSSSSQHTHVTAMQVMIVTRQLSRFLIAVWRKACSKDEETT